MALKGMEAYMDSDDEGIPKGSPSSYSTISNDEDIESEPNGAKSQGSVSRETGPSSRSPTEFVEPLENPKMLYGFPHNLELTDEEKVTIPPDTTRSVSSYLEGRIAELITKQKRQNLDVNYEIQKSKAFRNPSIYQKLIEYCEIDEFGTNFDKDDFDPKRWDESSSMEALVKAQLIATEKHEKEKKAKGGTDVGVKRKTKWDTEPKAGTRVVGHGVSKYPSTGNLSKSTK